MLHAALTRKAFRSLTRHVTTVLFAEVITLYGLTWLYSPDACAFQHSSTFGPLTEYGSRLEQHMRADEGFPAPLTYINAAHPPSPEEWQTIHQQLISGAIIIVDGTTSFPFDIQQISSKAGGLGIKGTIVMIRKQPGKLPEYKDLQWLPSSSADDDGGTTGIGYRIAGKLADETRKMLMPWRLSPHHRTAARPGSPPSSWKPELAVFLEIRQLGFPCLVGNRYEGNGITGHSVWDDTLVNACNDEASVSLNYSVELIRSKQIKGVTHDAKIVRITMDPGNSGGAGWHLVDQPQHRHTWFESWTNRETWYGPVAESYAVTLEPLDPDIRLYHAVPANHPGHSRIASTSKIRIGVSLAADMAFPPRNNHGDENGECDEQQENAHCCHGNTGHEAHDEDDGAHPPTRADTQTTQSGQPAATSQGGATSSGNEGGSCCCGGRGGSSDSGGGQQGSQQGAGPGSGTATNPASGDGDEESGSGRHTISVDPYEQQPGKSCCHSKDDGTFPGTEKDDEEEDPDDEDEDAPLRRSMPANPITTSAWQDNMSSSGLTDRQHTSLHGRRRVHAAAQFRNIGPGLSFTYESKRSIFYQNHEYEVINRTRAGTRSAASWLWTRNFSRHAGSWRTNDTCPLWCSDWFFADNAFSPAAYAHFVPGFSATFMVPAGKTGQSTIRFTSSIKPVALGGRVQYMFLYQKYAPFSRKGVEHHLVQDLVINWDSSAFAAEAPISLEALYQDTQDGACLTAHSASQESLQTAGISSCQLQQNQLWGFDTESRLRSFLAYDYCLDRKPDDTLSLRRCNLNSSQKWRWIENNLVNWQGGYLSISPEGSLHTSWTPSELTAWHGFIRQPHSANALRVDPGAKNRSGETTDVAGDFRDDPD